MRRVLRCKSPPCHAHTEAAQTKTALQRDTPMAGVRHAAPSPVPAPHARLTLASTRRLHAGSPAQQGRFRPPIYGPASFAASLPVPIAASRSNDACAQRAGAPAWPVPAADRARGCVCIRHWTGSGTPRCITPTVWNVAWLPLLLNSLAPRGRSTRNVHSESAAFATWRRARPTPPRCLPKLASSPATVAHGQPLARWYCCCEE